MDSANTSHLPENTADGATLGLGWAALGDASNIIAQLAGDQPETNPILAPQFAARIWNAEPWQADLVEKGMADLRAVMEPGIAALLAISERGGNCQPAAKSLWREFTNARCALLSLLPVSADKL